MKKLACLLSLCAASMFAADGKWTGMLADAKCGKNHADGSEKSAKCAQACVKNGQDAVLVSGEEVIKIANQDAVKEHVGHKVTIEGNLENNTLTVKNVKAATT